MAQGYCRCLLAMNRVRSLLYPEIFLLLRIIPRMYEMEISVPLSFVHVLYCVLFGGGPAHCWTEIRGSPPVTVFIYVVYRNFTTPENKYKGSCRKRRMYSSSVKSTIIIFLKKSPHKTRRSLLSLNIFLFY